MNLCSYEINWVLISCLSSILVPTERKIITSYLLSMLRDENFMLYYNTSNTSNWCNEVLCLKLHEACKKLGICQIA